MNNAELVKHFVDAMMASDVEAMKQCIDANIVWNPPTSVAQQFGKQVVGEKPVISFLSLAVALQRFSMWFQKMTLSHYTLIFMLGPK